MRTRLALSLVLALVGCTATPAVAVAPDAALRGLTGAGYACDAGANEAHSDTIAWSCAREIEGGTARATIRGTAETVGTVGVRVPRAAGEEAARTAFRSAVAALGLPDALASALMASIDDWDGGNAAAEVGETSWEWAGAGNEVVLTLDLDP